MILKESTSGLDTCFSCILTQPEQLQLMVYYNTTDIFVSVDQLTVFPDISDACYLYSSLQTELSEQRELLNAVVLHQMVWTGAVTEKNDSYSTKGSKPLHK